MNERKPILTEEEVILILTTLTALGVFGLVVSLVVRILRAIG